MKLASNKITYNNRILSKQLKNIFSLRILLKVIHSQNTCKTILIAFFIAAYIHNDLPTSKLF